MDWFKNHVEMHYLKAGFSESPLVFAYKSIPLIIDVWMHVKYHIYKKMMSIINKWEGCWRLFNREVEKLGASLRNEFLIVGDEGVNGGCLGLDFCQGWPVGGI